MQTGEPDGMVHVPGGTFRMGSDVHYPEERPAHGVTIDGFWIDRFAVTNADFAAFVAATGYVTFAERPPDPALYPGARAGAADARQRRVPHAESPVRPRDLRDWWNYVPGADWRHPDGPGSTIAGREHEPVVHVAFEDAAAYAAWAGKDLPTEAEWEFAARGGLDGAAYCWGDEFTPDGTLDGQYLAGRIPLAEPGTGRVRGARAGRLVPANGYGLYDMAGNVWEWTNDWYAAGHPARSAASRAARRAIRAVRRGTELRSHSARAARRAQGDQGRLVSLRAELLPALSAGRAPPADDRHHHLPHRLPLRGSHNRGNNGRAS